MKKLDYTNPGGIDFKINDLQFVYDALRESLLGSVSWLTGLVADPVIIGGCVITEAGGNFTHTDGWIWKSGELYYVPALTNPTAIALARYGFQFTNNEPISAGTRVCEDSSSSDMQLNSYASIIRTNSAVDVYSDSNRYGEMLKAIMLEGAWVPAVLQNGWVGPEFKMKLDRFGVVEFSGDVSHTGIILGQQLICTIDPAYRPAVDKHFLIDGLDTGGLGAFAKIIVYTDGRVEFNTTHYGAGDAKSAYLHAIRFRK